jgi:hypothetical protein
MSKMMKMMQGPGGKNMMRMMGGIKVETRFIASFINSKCPQQFTNNYKPRKWNY